MHSTIEPRRLALRYKPPGIIVEYVYHTATTKQLYHHEIDLRAELSSNIGEYCLENLVRDIVKDHADIVGNSKVSDTQLVRLLGKLVDQQKRQPSDMKPLILPQADYNRVSETQLSQVKHKMDLVFQQNVICPNQDGYQYDKPVEFQPATEISDWDD